MSEEIRFAPLDRRPCPNCGRKTFFVDICGNWECSYCHHQESEITSSLIEMSKTADKGDWANYNKAKTKLNETIQKCLSKHQKKFEKEGIYPKFAISEENPCIVKSFEAVDEAGHTIRAVLGVEDGVHKFSICHTEDSKEHVCYQSVEKPEDEYQFVKKMFEAWGYKMTGEVVGESCL